MQFTDEELRFLAELLDSTYRDLKSEIYKTDDRDYKAGLNDRKMMIESLMRKLGLLIDAKP